MSDPTTTLFTFMLKTRSTVQAVKLLGSWDNFSRAYSMERDSRRDRGQWRGCHTFRDIICDGDSGNLAGKRNGGLKMGQTYYYYYELDGTTETHDPSVPSTNSCPFLPGQTVNTLWVPVEETLRVRSASMNSVRSHDFKTMNPDAKFLRPRPAPSPPLIPSFPVIRLGTAPAQVKRKASARSLSPSSGWSLSRKMFGRKTSSSSLKEDIGRPILAEDQQSIKSSEGTRSRDISPECLRRFLSDDELPSPAEMDSGVSTERLVIVIPEDIVEENEDDDNFATSAVSESLPYTTVLSPPPSRRSPSPPSTIGQSRQKESREGSVTPTFLLPPSSPPPPPPVASAAPVRASPRPRPPRLQRVDLPQFQQPRSHFSLDSSIFSPSPPQSPDSPSLPSFYFSDDDDDDDDDDEPMPFPAEEETTFDQTRRGNGPGVAVQRNAEASLSTYSLPRSRASGRYVKQVPGSTGAAVSASLGSPALVVRNGTDVPAGNTSLLASPAPDSGLDDLVNELGWIADVIGGSKGSMI